MHKNTAILLQKHTLCSTQPNPIFMEPLIHISHLSVSLWTGKPAILHNMVFSRISCDIVFLYFSPNLLDFSLRLYITQPALPYTVRCAMPALMLKALIRDKLYMHKNHNFHNSYRMSLPLTVQNNWGGPGSPLQFSLSAVN